MQKSPVQTVKKFEREVHKKITKVFPKLVDNEARKILDAGKPKSAKPPMVDVDVGTPIDIEPSVDAASTPCKKALEVYGSKVKAARALGIAETTFRDRLKKELAASGRFDDRMNPP